MEGEFSGVQQAQDQVGQGENQQQGGQKQDVGAQQKQGQQAPQKDAVSGDDGTDYVAQLKAKDAEIESLQAKVAEAAKTAEATEGLGKEIADLKARLADERTEFALRSAGARSVTAAKALLAEHDGDVAALVKAEPWLFDAGDSGKGGATGLEPAGASGGSDDQYLKHWERIAGLADEGYAPRPKKSRYLNQFELHKLLSSLELGSEPSWEWFILLVAKTGLRFSEALALTPADFDFKRQTLSVSKTWDYKNGGGFVATKNRSSVRKVQIDWQLIVQLSALVKDLPSGKPVFVSSGAKVYNSTANSVLARQCKQAGVPVISIHGLRGTHASLLLFAGVSIASVAKRLGYASMNTTEKTYLRIIQELENKDVDLVMRSLTSLV